MDVLDPRTVQECIVEWPQVRGKGLGSRQEEIAPTTALTALRGVCARVSPRPESGPGAHRPTRSDEQVVDDGRGDLFRARAATDVAGADALARRDLDGVLHGL